MIARSGKSFRRRIARIAVLLPAVVLIAHLTLAAQPQVEPPPPDDAIVADTTASRTTPAPDEPGIVTRLLDDVARQAGAPFAMNRDEALHWSGAAFVMGGLMFSDRVLDMTMRPLRDSIAWIGKASPVVTELGGTAGIAGAGLFIGYSLLFGDHDDRVTARMLAEALVTTTIWTRALKYAGGRRRPATMYAQGYDAGSQWLGPLVEIRNPDHLSSAHFASFPSGHTSTAFAIATVFAERYDRTATVPVIAYSLATLVGLSRMIEHQHWSSDVFVGACVGYLCGHDVVLHGDASRHAEAARPGTMRLGVYPMMLDDGGGIAVEVRF